MRLWPIMMTLLVIGVLPVCAEQAEVTVTKMPANVKTQIFDPRRPPRDMPPLTPPEEAVCASDFLSTATVGGQAALTDSTHGKLTINKITITLKLNITI